MKRIRKSWTSKSSDETISHGKSIAKMVKPGSLIALEGDLGSGKTTLTKGIALGFGVKTAREVKSPTFVILHLYKGRIPLYHFDLYRLDNESDLEAIGLEEFLNDPNGISIIEWADRIPQVSKRADLVIQIERKGKDERLIKVYER